jgi:hypothetical protein
MSNRSVQILSCPCDAAVHLVPNHVPEITCKIVEEIVEQDRKFKKKLAPSD